MVPLVGHNAMMLSDNPPSRKQKAKRTGTSSADQVAKLERVFLQLLPEDLEINFSPTDLGERIASIQLSESIVSDHLEYFKQKGSEQHGVGVRRRALYVVCRFLADEFAELEEGQRVGGGSQYDPEYVGYEVSLHSAIGFDSWAQARELSTQLPMLQGEQQLSPPTYHLIYRAG